MRSCEIRCGAWISRCYSSGRLGFSFLDALERTLYLLMRIPQSDGSAMRTARRMLGFAQFCEQPVDLLGVQGHVDLDCGMACDGGGRSEEHTSELQSRQYL